MNMFTKSLLLAAMAFMFVGCDLKKSTEQPEFTVRWDGGVTLYTVLFRFNDDTVGRGRMAYAKLIKRIESIPDGSHLRFEYPEDIAALMTELSQTTEPLPFRGYESERKYFVDMQVRKKLRVTINSYKQPDV